MKKKIAILGSTGSVGKQTIDIIRKNKKNFKVLLLTANKNHKLLSKQIFLSVQENYETIKNIYTDQNSNNFY